MEIMNAKKTLELGVFTGYSLLTTALVLEESGKVTGIDIDKDAYNMSLEFIKNSGVDHKVTFIQYDGVQALEKMRIHKPEFDFAYVDADKQNYSNMHERLMKMVKVVIIITFDNTLWFGFVAEEEESVQERMRENRETLIDFNKRLAADPRIELHQVSFGDGVTLCSDKTKSQVDKAGVLRDQEGHLHNEKGQKFDAEGNVIAEIVVDEEQADGVDRRQLGVDRHLPPADVCGAANPDNNPVRRHDQNRDLIWTIADFNRAELMYENRDAIVPPPFQRNDFELKPAYFQLVGQSLSQTCQMRSFWIILSILKIW
ncbi:PREDICTED: putative caffeoyl-CoA O-methyltransferase At1g67980 [Camelina sativa]|uniref:Caffeoyl-CoA O-methyltransferase At1g67980 n=1 Tax=Camelina sativa TaxID=90675 RepID=A0ABM0TAV8_CAMSA|nr:PREDICTED: putative caffeoyl-CoA O-methyltransferase At1g67980 [Camelina sativa]